MEKCRKIIGKVPTGVMSGITVALILWLTLAPHPTGDLEIPLFPGADKIVHGIMFVFLSIIVLLDIMKHRDWQPLGLVTVSVVSLLCAVFGIGIEIAQRAMGLGRSFEILDILADTAGAVLGGGIWAVLQSVIAKPDS